MENKHQVPVTVLTGFLGAGKTTLLNRILTEQHGQKYAVIVNEFGEQGIDNDLVVDADEEVFEMNNGCICCTVRGDLIRILSGLMKRARFINPLSILIRSPLTVQHIQPLFISKTSSSASTTRSLSIPCSPNSFTITAYFWPCCSVRILLRSVVFPAPRKPVKTVTGTWCLFSINND